MVYTLEYTHGGLEIPIMFRPIQHKPTSAPSSTTPMDSISGLHEIFASLVRENEAKNKNHLRSLTDVTCTHATRHPTTSHTQHNSH